MRPSRLPGMYFTRGSTTSLFSMRWQPLIATTCATNIAHFVYTSYCMCMLSYYILRSSWLATSLFTLIYSCYVILCVFCFCIYTTPQHSIGDEIWKWALTNKCMGGGYIWPTSLTFLPWAFFRGCRISPPIIGRIPNLLFKKKYLRKHFFTLPPRFKILF